MTELVSTYGLSALFLGVMLEAAGIPVPGEAALIVASIPATRGIFALTSVIAVAATAAIVGDNIGYWTGRRGGRQLLERWRPLTRYADRVLPAAERSFESHGGQSIFLARFIPVLRVAGAFTAGWHGWIGGGSSYGTWPVGWPGQRVSLSSPTTSGPRRSRR